MYSEFVSYLQIVPVFKKLAVKPEKLNPVRIENLE